MGKIIGGVVAGYVVMFIGVFLLFTAAYLTLGASGSFKPGSWDVKGSWIVLTVLIGLAAAIAGGYVCAAIAQDPNGPKILVAVVLVLGFLLAIPVITGAGEVATTARPDTVPMFDAMNNANQPVWVALLNPLLGAVGVVIGARLRQGGKAVTATDH